MSITSVTQRIREALADGVVTAEELNAIAAEARKDGLSEEEKLLVQDFILQHYEESSFAGARTTADALFDEFYAPRAENSARATQVSIDGRVYQAFQTAGGYTIVIEGNGAISIYGPGQAVDGSTPPLTRIWGDPHVNEGDGNNWDFTRDGDLVLPDGTVIALNTTSETGASVLDSLTIVSGQQRIEVTDLQSSTPTIAGICQDGEAWLAQYLAAHPNRERYHLYGTDPSCVEWYLERNGRMVGRISGSRSVDGTFEVDTDALGSGSGDMTLAGALGLLRENFLQIDQADGLADGEITLLGLAKIVNDPNASPQLKAAARYLLEHKSDLAKVTGKDLRLTENELITAHDEHAAQAEIDFAREEMDHILADGSLTIEDRIMFLLFLLMKTLDRQIERQGRYIMDLQLGGLEGEARRRARQGKQAGGARPAGWAEAARPQEAQKDRAGDDKVKQQSIDTETLNLKRLVDKRSQIFDTLRQIIDRYNQTAKSLIDSMGR